MKLTFLAVGAFLLFAGGLVLNLATVNAAAFSALPQDAPRISVADAKKAFDDGTAVFIDTRNAASYNDERIKGALNYTVSDIEKRIAEIPKDKKIIAYCS